MAFYGDASFPFQIHGVEQLIFHLSLEYGLGAFEKPIRQGSLAMINMSDDTKIANPVSFHH